MPVTASRVAPNAALPKQCKDEETAFNGQCLSCPGDLSLVPLVAADGTTRYACTAATCADGRYACGG